MQKHTVIVFGSQKGGAGKTTISTAVAGELARLGRRTVFVDADPQLSGESQMSEQPDILYFAYTRGGLDKILPKLMKKLGTEKGHAVIVVDTPSGINEPFLSSLKVADVLIVPTRASPHDLASMSRTIEIAKEQGIKTAVVLNDIKARTRYAKQAPGAVRKYGVHLFKQAINSRNAHCEAVAYRQAITRIDINGGHAADEIRKLTREIIAFMGG